MSDWPAKVITQYPLLRWIALLSYTALIYYLCLLPSSKLPGNTFLDQIHFDKWVHVMMYFGLWSLWVWVMKGPGSLHHNRLRHFIIAAVISLLIGASIEWLQGLTGRGIDWTDELANLCGVLLAYSFWIRFEHRWRIYSW